MKQKDIIICDLCDQIKILKDQFLYWIARYYIKFVFVTSERKKIDSVNESQKKKCKKPVQETNAIYSKQEDEKIGLQPRWLTKLLISWLPVKLRLLKVLPQSQSVTTPFLLQTQENGRNSQTRNIAKNGITGNLKHISNIKVVPKKSFLYVSRLYPSTKCEDVVKLLKNEFPEVLCETLTTKYPEHYAFFKVTLNLNNLSRAMNPDFWPNGCYVSRFFRPRVQPIAQT